MQRNTYIMEQDQKDEYITLREAANLCRYSQEYLSLRSRQGKLKALKFGRNWVTKKEWIQDYLKESCDPDWQIKKENEPVFQAPAADSFSAGRNLHQQKELKELSVPETAPSPVFIKLAAVLFLFSLIIFGGLALNLSHSSTLPRTSELFVPYAVKSTADTFFEYGSWLRLQTFAAAGDIKDGSKKISLTIKKSILGNSYEENGNLITATAASQNSFGIAEAVRTVSLAYWQGIGESFSISRNFIEEKTNRSREWLSLFLVKKIAIENPAI